MTRRSNWVYPYKQGSRSARDLARSIGAKVIRRERSRFRPTLRKTVINWGSSEMPGWSVLRRVLNGPERVSLASNKLRTFETLQGKCRIPEFATSPGTLNWTGPVIARTTLTGHSGQGVVYCEEWDSLPEAPLYVRYIKKKDEYRVHVVAGGVILVQKKMKRRDLPNDQINYQIRNHANGFIYATDPETLGTVPEDVYTQGLAASAAMGLDFCAVDVIWNEHQQKAYVLEVNTAPGLTGNTLSFYTEAFNNLLA